MLTKLFAKAGAKIVIEGSIPIQHASLLWHMLIENIHNGVIYVRVYKYMYVQHYIYTYIDILYMHIVYIYMYDFVILIEIMYYIITTVLRWGDVPKM